MKPLLLGLGLLLAGLTAFYLTMQSRGETIPDALTYGLGITACLFLTILLYRAMQYFKKK